MTTFGIGLVALAIGAILVAVAIWRSAMFARWVGIPFAAAIVLFLPQFYASPSVRIAHGVLMLVGLALLAGAMWRAAARVGDSTPTATVERVLVGI